MRLLKGCFSILLLLALASPADAGGSADLLLLCSDSLVVVQGDGFIGEIPLRGQVKASLLVKFRPILVLHLPSKGMLAVVDVRPFSPTKYQVLASYSSTAFFQAGLELVESLRKVYLVKGRTVVAGLDLDRFKLEASKLDSLPISPAPSRILSTEKGRMFYLSGGNLLYEESRPPTLPAPRPIPLSNRPVDLLLDGKTLFVLERGQDQGVLQLFDAESLELTREVPIEHLPNSMAAVPGGVAVLLDDGWLWMFENKGGRWMRKWKPKSRSLPLRLLQI